MERKCQNCRHVDVCLKRSLAIFNMFIVTGRYNEVERQEKPRRIGRVRALRREGGVMDETKRRNRHH